MSFFCLCTAKSVSETEARGLAVDTYDMLELEQYTPPHVGVLLPEYAIPCVKVGVRQFLALACPNKDDQLRSGMPVREHYPNVDILRCPLCGSGFAR